MTIRMRRALLSSMKRSREESSAPRRMPLANTSRGRMEPASRWWASYKTENTQASPKSHRRRCFFLFASRMATASLGVLGALGAILSITGIFGISAYSVSKRLRELGIRMALGAQWKEVLGAALGRALKLLPFGSAAGLLLGILASRVLASIVYQATPRDPLVLSGVVLAMALLGLVATWIPAQRALSIDPATLLRED